MREDHEPLDALRADVEQAVHRPGRQVVDWARKWLGATLLKLIAGGAVSVGLLWAAFPYFAAALATIVVVASVLVAIYSRKLLVDERAVRRWAWVAGKRVQKSVWPPGSTARIRHRPTSTAPHQTPSTALRPWNQSFRAGSELDAHCG